MFKWAWNGTKFLIRLIKPNDEEIFLQTHSMWVFQLKFSSMCTPRDLVEDTCSIGKLSMVRDGLSDKEIRLCLEVIEVWWALHLKFVRSHSFNRDWIWIYPFYNSNLLRLHAQCISIFMPFSFYYRTKSNLSRHTSSIGLKEFGNRTHRFDNVPLPN